MGSRFGHILDAATQLHATALRYRDAGVLICGPSGAGKSALALQLVALGAQLIADDQVMLHRSGDHVIVSRPSDLPQAIEARGFGMIDMACAEPARLALLVDLSRVSQSRYTDPSYETVIGCRVEVMTKIDAVHFPAAILAYLGGKGRYQVDN